MISPNPDFIYLPVSLGEAIDKITILNIKLEKINDNRKNDVKKEYDLLYEKLETFIITYDELYQTMKRVNLLLWDMMDILRDGNVNKTEYLQICKECIEYNDIRFRIKNKINCISKSSLKEQKSYKINRLLIHINDEIQDITEFINPIKYYSLIYDEIVIISNNNELKKKFNWDSTIIFEKTHHIELYKRQYLFLENKYDKDEIYKIFELDMNCLFF
jgi:hypothetical protein